LLATALNTARFEVQPLGAFTGDRMEFAVRRWDGATSRVLGQVTLMLERRATVTRLRQDVPRDRVLTVDDLETSEAWLSASEALNVAPRDAIVGRSLTRSLKAGDVIRTRDLQQEVLVKRGDVVTVRCLVGGVAISLQAEARADGAQGDAVEFRKTGERENFVATITGRNQAMVDLSRR
jgi:flagella basal body P-ring formation protein FlgA